VICCNEASLRNFPQSLHLKDHEICRPCIAKHIQVKILDHGEMDIGCPDGDCVEVLGYNEVKQHCVQSTFNLYQSLQFALTAVGMNNFS